jgi:phosphatidylglycerol:prolipoprotein diacylglycerol transferase
LFPYIEIGAFQLGSYKIEPFGTIVLFGVLVGWLMCKWLGKRQGMTMETRLLTHLLIWGFLGAHLVDVFGYQPERLRQDPLLVFKIWKGISSYGGVLGAFIAFFILIRKHPELNVARFADVAMFGFVPGFWIGRLGCALVHDHIGAPTDFFLAVNFPPNRYAGIPEGGMHHDLGLYEALFVMPFTFLVMCIPLLFRRRPDGLMTALAAIAYSVPRFFLDFLRRAEPDPRYLGLTWGHYLSVITFAVGVYMLYRIYVKKARLGTNSGDSESQGPPAAASGGPIPVSP